MHSASITHIVHSLTSTVLNRSTRPHPHLNPLNPTTQVARLRTTLTQRSARRTSHMNLKNLSDHHLISLQHLGETTKTCGNTTRSKKSPGGHFNNAPRGTQ